ncbi:MAG TPA: hypothetical protein VIJ43_10865 [Burkholderiales bacterium]
MREIASNVSLGSGRTPGAPLGRRPGILGPAMFRSLLSGIVFIGRIAGLKPKDFEAAEGFESP